MTGQLQRTWRRAALGTALVLTSLVASDGLCDEVMLPLKVDGFAPALHAAPAHMDEGARARPVMVFLHGVNANVAEQCGQWLKVGRAHGWMLCVRGVRQPGTAPRQNRWTHHRGQSTQLEIDAALTALETRYPGRVTRRDMVLAGYSRGAILAPGLAAEMPGRYAFLFLAHGGMEQLEGLNLGRLHDQGLRGVGLAMGTKAHRREAQRILKSIEARGLRTVYVDMPGSGHRMGERFEIDGVRGLLQLTGVSPKRRRPEAIPAMVPLIVP